MRGRERYTDKPRAYDSRGDVDFDELRKRANANLAQLAADRRAQKPVPVKPEKVKREVCALDLELGDWDQELRELQRLERRIAKASERGFKNSDYDQGMWEEVDHRIEQLQERLSPLDNKELKRVRRIWRKHNQRKVKVTS